MTDKKSILVLDMSYTLDMFKEREMMEALTSRNLSGFFETVISVHPLSGLFEKGDARYGKPIVSKLSEKHLFIEGKVGAYKWPGILFPLNFFIVQIQLIKYLSNICRDHNILVIRIGDPYYLGIVGLILSKILKVPLVIRVCSRFDEIYKITKKPIMPRLFFFRWIEKIVEKMVFPRCDLIAGANEDNMNYALENGGKQEVSTVFRYGNLIHPKHWLEIDERDNADDELVDLGLMDKVFTITVTRLEPVKDVDHVIKVVGELKKRGYEIYALIVGDGSQFSELSMMANNLGISNQIIFTGNKSQQWIAKILPKAKIVLSPQMGRGLTEAALASVPVVAYDRDWQSEVVVSEETGYLVENHDWVAMADGVEKLLLNEEKRVQMGINVREKTLKMMNPDDLERHEINEYKKLFKRYYGD